MSASITRTPTEGGHSCPPEGGLETPDAISCEGWSESPLESIARTTSGGTPDRKRAEFYGGGIPWVKSGELNDSYIFATEESLSPEGLKQSSAKLFPAGTLLMAMYGATVGKTAILKMDAATNQAVCAIFPDAAKANSDFLRYFLIGERQELLKQRYGGAQPNISQNVIRNFPVRRPPLHEQQKIAAVLGVVQRSMEQQERLLALTAELKKALLHQLFTAGLRGEPQKQTDLGPVPESWEVMPLGELVEDAPPVNIRAEGNREIQYIDVSSISREFLHIESTARHVLKDAPGRARKKVKTGDVIFATVRPTLLRVARISREYDEQICSTAFCVLRDRNKNTIGRFIYYLAQRERFVKQLAAIESGVSYPAVTDRQVKAQLVPVPHEEEQVEIATILEVCDAKIRTHARKHAAFTALFRTLLHQLMTAQIRVNDLDLRDETTK